MELSADSGMYFFRTEQTFNFRPDGYKSRQMSNEICKKNNIQSRKRYVTITDSFVTELNNVEPDIIRLKYNKFKFRSTILQKLYTILGKSVPSHVARPVLYRISTTCVNCV